MIVDLKLYLRLNIFPSLNSLVQFVKIIFTDKSALLCDFRVNFVIFAICANRCTISSLFLHIWRSLTKITRMTKNPLTHVRRLESDVCKIHHLHVTYIFLFFFNKNRGGGAEWVGWAFVHSVLEQIRLNMDSGSYQDGSSYSNSLSVRKIESN